MAGETGQKSGWKGRKEKVDGIDIIRNPKTPLYGPDVFRLEEEWTVGPKEGEKNVDFTTTWSLAVDDEERIYVMDVRDACVKVFDRKGALIKTIGRRGEGPGEVQKPNRVSLIGNRRLIFEDFLSRINVYELDGRFIKAIPTSGILPLDVMVTRREKIFARVNCREPGKNGKEIRLYDERMNLIKTCLFMPEPPAAQGVVRLFAAGFYWALGPDDNLFVSYLADYQIDVLNASGDRIRRIFREYEPIE